MLAVGSGGDKICVVGHVKRRGDSLRAPISGRPCVAFQAEIEEQRGQKWVSRLRVREAQPFVVVDESGPTFVDVEGPFELELSTDEEGSTGLFGRMGAAQRQVVKSYVKPSVDLFGASNKVRYREGILRDGQSVAVGGPGTRELSAEIPSSGLREPGTWLVLRGTTDQPLLISNALRAIGGD
jgi:hypothetical protein